jgi:hypothetical protein
MNSETKNRFLYLGSGMMATLTEMTLLGHTMESTKIIKQATAKSYPNIFRNLWKESGWKGYYRGFYPWAIIQSTKGIPILYTQSFVKDNIIKNQSILGFNSDNIERTSGIIGGMCGGVAQSFFITPTQRLKIEAMTMNHKSSQKKVSSGALVSNIWKEQGFRGFYRGLSPMILKKGVDWGIRFYGVELFKEQFPEFYETLPGKFGAGMFGGALSLLTVPFDVMVASLQKSNGSGNLVEEFNELRKLGIRHFYRGGAMRFLHTSYHTGILIGFGSIYKDFMDEALFGNKKNMVV